MNHRIKRYFAAVTGTVLLLMIAVPAWAQPVFNPANGHYYLLVEEDGAEGLGWTWQEAANAAAGMSFAGFDGHLVTITSQQENDFLENDMDIPQNAWIGGVQDPAGAEPAGGWEWITGEQWAFTSWANNEPNNAGGNEECAQWWSPDGTWNDRTCSESFSSYVVEFGELEAPPARATFAVQKAYSDDNPDPVAVTLSCNTGLPLEQTIELDPDRFGDEYIEFVVVDFESGTLDCEITEEDLAAYTPTYLYWIDNVNFGSPDSCVFEDVEHGEVASTIDGIHNMCFIGNTLNFSTVTVIKEWIDENPQFAAVNYAEANWFCSNIPVDNFNFQLPVLGGSFDFGAGRGTGITASGSLEFIGNPGVDYFLMLGNWDGGTQCEVTEQFVETGVEADDSDCASVVVGPGEDVECTIVNTRLYEGIPTLSQYGLALLAMLMLGMGLVAFRRFA